MTRASWVNVSSLDCDGGNGPGGDLTDIHVVFDQKPFTCEGACNLVFLHYGDIECESDWRLHMRFPAAPGVYAVGPAGAESTVALVSGPGADVPSACEEHQVLGGTVEITSVTATEVTGVVSGIAVASAPGVDPNGAFTATRCD